MAVRYNAVSSLSVVPRYAVLGPSVKPISSLEFPAPIIIPGTVKLPVVSNTQLFPLELISILSIELNDIFDSEFEDIFPAIITLAAILMYELKSAILFS